MRRMRVAKICALAQGVLAAMVSSQIILQIADNP